jgi:hypothetical protein
VGSTKEAGIGESWQNGGRHFTYISFDLLFSSMDMEAIYCSETFDLAPNYTANNPDEPTRP